MTLTYDSVRAEVAEAAAIAAWKHAAGDGLKEHAIALKLENRMLTVAVACLFWLCFAYTWRMYSISMSASVFGPPGAGPDPYPEPWPAGNGNGGR